MYKFCNINYLVYKFESTEFNLNENIIGRITLWNFRILIWEMSTDSDNTSCCQHISGIANITRIM